MRKFKIVGILFTLSIIISIIWIYQLHHSYGSLVPWSQISKLTWKDFRRKIPKKTSNDAYSGFIYRYTEELKGDSIEIGIFNDFCADSAFVVKGKETDDLLNYEQRHFDIWEIHTRQLKKYLTEWKGSSKEDYNRYLFYGAKQIFHDSLAKLYANQTNDGFNKYFQQLWNQKIDSLLSKYEPFKKNIFKIYWPSTSKDFNDNSYVFYWNLHHSIIDTTK